MHTMESIRETLAKLRLNTMAEHLDAVLKQAREKNHDAVFVLARLLELETENPDARELQKAYRRQYKKLFMLDTQRG